MNINLNKNSENSCWLSHSLYLFRTETFLLYIVHVQQFTKTFSMIKLFCRYTNNVTNCKNPVFAQKIQWHIFLHSVCRRISKSILNLEIFSRRKKTKFLWRVPKFHFRILKNSWNNATSGLWKLCVIMLYNAQNLQCIFFR